jgi:copper homeostasis protein
VVILEACVESVDEARAAEAGGAARVELCIDLAVQGTTPPDLLLGDCVRALTIPVCAMVRPRGGPFVYSPSEIAAMREDVRRARALGARGIVTGALTEAGGVDAEAMRALVEAAGPLPTTFHRAFDLIRDRREALESLIAIGIARVLTSGGAATAVEGADAVETLVRQAAGRLVVVAAGGIRAHNVRAVVEGTGVTEVHAHVTTVEDVTRLVRAATTPP